ncbi:MAG: hydrogenase expression/formation protein, partial [Methylobacter sp.]|nr:hydrogenase expression/formation protein [Methylobacter sp.]
ELDDYGGSLRPIVKAQIQPAIDMALSYLHAFGIHAEITAAETDLSDPVLDLQRYEQERPTASEACRTGDERVLQLDSFELRPPQPIGENTVQVDVDYRGKY